MSADYEEVEAPLSVSFKTSPGFEAAQLTVRGNDAAQLVERLDVLQDEVLTKVIETNNLLQSQNLLLAPEEDKKDEKGKPAARRSSGGSSRGSSGSSRGSSRGSSSGNKSRSEIAEEDLHPEGLTCDKRNCEGRVRYKEITAAGGKEYELWVCEFQRSKGDGHFSEFIN